MAKKNKPGVVGTDRQAKIQAASKGGGGGAANTIIIAAVIAVVAIVAVVGFVVWQSVSAKNEIRGDGNAAPISAQTGGPYTAYQDVTVKEGAPTLEVFEDFQCPACAQFEGLLGSTIEELASAGDIKLQYHVLNFLDSRLGNNGSTMAGNAAFCAADAGKFQDVHDALYANQPAEGSGWTLAQLTPVAEGAGLSGAELTAWSSCVEVGRYTNYINSVNTNAFDNEGVKGTPTFKLNGAILDNKTIASPDLLKAVVAAATK